MHACTPWTVLAATYSTMITAIGLCAQGAGLSRERRPQRYGDTCGLSWKLLSRHDALAYRLGSSLSRYSAQAQQYDVDVRLAKVPENRRHVCYRQLPASSLSPRAPRPSLR